VDDPQLSTASVAARINAAATMSCLQNSGLTAKLPTSAMSFDWFISSTRSRSRDFSQSGCTLRADDDGDERLAAGLRAFISPQAQNRTVSDPAIDS
jgi:hypothetical protein